MSYTDALRAQLRQEIASARGYFSDFHESLLRLSPETLKLYFDYVSAQTKTGLLSSRDRQLIYIALDASVTHLYPRGVEIHSMLAMREGASPEEIFETLQIACEIASITNELGVAVLADEMRRAGRDAELTPDAQDSRYATLKQEFVAKRGAWPAWLDFAFREAPDYAAAFVRLALAPWTPGVLSPKFKELIYVAHYAAPTVRYEPGLRAHIRRALELGASAGELMEVLQLSGSISIHSFSVGAPALTRVMDEPEEATKARYGIAATNAP